MPTLFSKRFKQQTTLCYRHSQSYSVQKPAAEGIWSTVSSINVC